MQDPNGAGYAMQGQQMQQFMHATPGMMPAQYVQPMMMNMGMQPMM